MLSWDGTVTIILRNNKSCAITMETRPLCPLPLCHHRCQSWKNLGSLCAWWYSWLCNRKGHRYPTDPFRDRTVPKLNTNKASLHRPVSHLLAEYSGFEATMMEKITRNPKHQSKQNERDKEILSHWQFLIFKSNSYDFEIWMSPNQNSIKPGKHKQPTVRLINYIREKKWSLWSTIL